MSTGDSPGTCPGHLAHPGGEAPVRTSELPWVPSGPGSAFRPLRFWAGGWSELMRLEPGVHVPLHRHTGSVDAYVLEGCRLLSNGEVLGPGDYQHEPAGTVDTWAATGTTPCVVHLYIEGAIEYLDLTGAVTAVVSSATQASAYEAWRTERSRASSPSAPSSPE